MLGIAIGLEIVAFTAIFRFGGLALGCAVLAVAAVALAVSLAAEKREEERRAHSRRVWTYFAVNDRLSERARIKGRGDLAPMNSPVSGEAGLIYFDGWTSTRSGRGQGRN